MNSRYRSGGIQHIPLVAEAPTDFLILLGRRFVCANANSDQASDYGADKSALGGTSRDGTSFCPLKRTKRGPHDGTGHSVHHEFGGGTAPTLRQIVVIRGLVEVCG